MRFCECLGAIADEAEATIDFSRSDGSAAVCHLKPPEVKKVELDIGCFWRQEGMDLIPFEENPKAFRLKSAHGPQSIISAQTAAAVRVKERTDAAFRRL